jgi:dUTP pyrophosphatase
MANYYEYTKINELAKAPTREHDAAAIDIYSSEDATVAPRKTVPVKTGLRIKPPTGSYARTVSRSGLALNNQIFVTADCIDPDYRGEIHMLLTNLGDEDFKVELHSKIGSIVFEKFEPPSHGREVQSMDVTKRGERRFGSSGTK